MDLLEENMYSYHEFYEGTDHPVYCPCCWEVISGPAYVIDKRVLPGPIYELVSEYAVHKSCVELPRLTQHPIHPQHPLTGHFTISAYCGFICDGCLHYAWGVRYACHECGLNFDFRCVSKLESQQQLALKERIEIANPFDNHEKLQLFYYDMPSTKIFNGIVCCCCSKGFRGSAYACLERELFIHESCIDKIPQQVKSPFHPKHPLLLRPTSCDQCLACAESIHGLKLSCEQCVLCDFHISCCTRATSGLRLKHREKHPMFYVHRCSLRKKCVVCNTTCRNCAAYSCLDCKVYVHMECIPLPRVVKHESHPFHALTLSDSTQVLKIASNEYQCVVCEKEGDLKHHFYYCEECSDPDITYTDIAHIDCVLYEEDSLSERLEYLVFKSDESDKETDKVQKETEEQEILEGWNKNFFEDYILPKTGEAMLEVIKKDMDELPSKHKKKVDELASKHKKEMDELASQHKKEMDQLASQHKKEMDISTSMLEFVQEISAQKNKIL